MGSGTNSWAECCSRAVAPFSEECVPSESVGGRVVAEIQTHDRTTVESRNPAAAGRHRSAAARRNAGSAAGHSAAGGTTRYSAAAWAGTECRVDIALVRSSGRFTPLRGLSQFAFDVNLTRQRDAEQCIGLRAAPDQLHAARQACCRVSHRDRYGWVAGHVEELG